MKKYLISLFVIALSFQVSATELDKNLFSQYELEKKQLAKLGPSHGADAAKKTVAERNATALKDLKRPVMQNPFARKRINKVSDDLANEIYDSVSNNPVAGLDKYSKYDPKDQGIGFCFGRAMTVHLESLFKGVSKRSIKKIWALGSLKTGGSSWRYHVSTLVLGEEGWLAIDPIMGYVMTVDQWYKNMKGYDSNGLMRIYITDAPKFGPSGGKYENADLLDPYYNEYFTDLMQYYREETRKKIEDRK